MQVSGVTAWAFYVQKLNAVPEQLTCSLGLVAPTPAVETGADTGQWLTAIELANDTHQVHIGALDEDWFASRAEADLWIPQRLASALGSYQLIITTIEETGLRTQVPQLREGEQFYFHYILAESPRHKSTEYPDEWDISTWYAVEQSREQLEKAWQQASS
ncbi:hypothetical protein [Hymenobacter coalescens]